MIPLLNLKNPSKKLNILFTYFNILPKIKLNKNTHLFRTYGTEGSILLMLSHGRVPLALSVHPHRRWTELSHDVLNLAHVPL